MNSKPETPSGSKIRTREELAVLLPKFKAEGRRIGYTSGVFDLLHPGHVRYLEEAKKRCDLLVVGVNSDSSVKSYKGPGRPICSAAERMVVVAGLASVDFVFVFDERNNNRNVELLKPDLYIKAGDYGRSTLTSASIVESYGGTVELVQFEGGFSTTSIIEKIKEQVRAVSLDIPPYQKQPAIFVDRDGTINEHVEYLSEPEKFKLISGALEALKKLRERGFRIVVVTNQPGIGMGYFTREDFFVVNRELLKAAGKVGLDIDRVYFCPHSKGDKCECRKPGTALVKRAVEDLNLDLSKSYMIGDMTGDIATGQAAGCRTVLVRTGRGGSDVIFPAVPDLVADDLREAADLILRESVARTDR